MLLYHNSRQAAYRSPFGAAPVGSSLTLSLDAAVPEGTAVILRLWQEGETRLSMAPSGENRWSCTLTLPEEPGLLWYYFVIEAPGKTLYYGKTAQCAGGSGALTETPPESWQITVYVPQTLPAWYENSVAYQIFPDRFHRGRDWQACQQAAAHPEGWKGSHRLVVQDWNDRPFYCKDSQGRVTRWPFFGGTLEGIREKLPYLQSLGIGVIYLNPIFTASSNHKYDTGDYLTIDPGFGDTAGFQRLCRDAADHGISILLDGVFSHTGDDSIYFNRWGNYPAPGAFSRSGSPYDSWYRFDEKYPCGYESWWGVDSLPDVEETNPDYQEFICGPEGVIRTWLRLGASGWRLDVADELPDSFIRRIRQAGLAERPDALLLGEVWEDASNKVSYHTLRPYLLGHELDCTMHYPFRAGTVAFLLGHLDAQELAERLDTLQENYPPSALYGALNLIGSHDTPRILTVLGEAPDNLSPQQQEEYTLPPHQRELALRRLRLLQVLQFTSPGVPCIYYGDEAGMEGFADPLNRGPFPWGHGEEGLTAQVRILSQLRQEYPVLIHGTVAYGAPHPEVFFMERTLEDVSVQIYVNRSEEHTLSLEVPACALELLSGQIRREGERLHLPPLSAALLYREGTDPARFSPLPAAARMPKGPGLLCPVFSLPGKAPTGTIADGLRFLEVLHQTGWKNWMLLPLCPPGLGNSPYSSPCVFAGDPRLVSPALSAPPEGFDAFCRENAYWLEDYALFTLLHRVYQLPWQQWPQAARDRENLAELRRQYASQLREIQETQYRFFAQWEQLHQKARSLGISLIGDLPIYAALDSAETWAHREQFQLDSQGYPILRAGCPPDYFSPEGQDWGNPLYLWPAMTADGFTWWKQRLRQALRCYDFLRLDHFRSFAAYYAIPAESTPKEGYWMKGVGVAFFREMAREFGTLPIVAEDLGALDSQVSVLLRHTGLAGMHVWQFSQEEMLRLSPEEAAHRVFFSGTHDNQTLAGFLRSTGDARAPAEILRQLLASPAGAVILPVQDVLGLGDEARINVPGVAQGNWGWRMTQAQLQRLLSGGILS